MKQSAAKKLLVIIDLNGTICHFNKNTILTKRKELLQKRREKYKEKNTIVEIKIIISFGNDSNFLYIEN